MATCILLPLGWPVPSVWHAYDKKKKKRGGKTYQVNPYMGFMPLPVQDLFVGQRGWLVVCRLQAVCRNCGWDIGRWCTWGHHCCRDLAMALLFCLLARQGWGHARKVFGCMSKGCANAQDWKKKKSNKNENENEKMKNRLTHTKMPSSTGLVCVVCVWGFSVGMQGYVWGWHGNDSIQMAMGADVMAWFSGGCGGWCSSRLVTAWALRILGIRAHREAHGLLGVGSRAHKLGAEVEGMGAVGTIEAAEVEGMGAAETIEVEGYGWVISKC